MGAACVNWKYPTAYIKPYGIRAYTWPSALVFAFWISKNSHIFGEQGSLVEVLELGTGTGLVSTLVTKILHLQNFASRVILTDQGDPPWILENVKRTLEINGLADD